jgi:hypothetical protein
MANQKPSSQLFRIGGPQTARHRPVQQAAHHSWQASAINGLYTPIATRCPLVTRLNLCSGRCNTGSEALDCGVCRRVVSGEKELPATPKGSSGGVSDECGRTRSPSSQDSAQQTAYEPMLGLGEMRLNNHRRRNLCPISLKTNPPTKGPNPRPKL